MSPEAATLLAENFAGILRRSGAREGELRFGEKETFLRVVFGAPEPTPTDAKSLMTSMAEETCKCGHGHHMHVNGLCVAGCEPTKCLGEGA